LNNLVQTVYQTTGEREKYPFNDKQSQIAERKTEDQQGPA
jgi:hypothetical protein